MDDVDRMTDDYAASAVAAADSRGHCLKAGGKRRRIVLVDDHRILREGLRALIEFECDLQVAGEAGSVDEAVRVFEALRPDLIISDISLPGAAGVQGIVELRRRCAFAPLLVLTVHDTEAYIRAALAAGADGYVLKDATRAELLQGVRAVLAGQRYLCPRAAARVVCTFLGEQAPAAPVAAGVTGREREILALIARGQSNKRIAIGLGRSVKTVEKHRANLMRKLDLHNCADVTRFALQSGLLLAEHGEGSEQRLAAAGGRGEALEWSRAAPGSRRLA